MCFIYLQCFSLSLSLSFKCSLFLFVLWLHLYSSISPGRYLLPGVRYVYNFFFFILLFLALPCLSTKPKTACSLDFSFTLLCWCEQLFRPLFSSTSSPHHGFFGLFCCRPIMPPTFMRKHFCNRVQIQLANETINDFQNPFVSFYTRRVNTYAMWCELDLRLVYDWDCALDAHDRNDGCGVEVKHSNRYTPRNNDDKLSVLNRNEHLRAAAGELRY